MAQQIGLPRWLTALLGTAAIVGIILGLQQARVVLVPFLLAAFLAGIAIGPVRWLVRFRVPSPVAVAVVVLVMGSTLAFLVSVVAGSLGPFFSRLPIYQERLRDDLLSLLGRVDSGDLPISGDEIVKWVDPGAALGFAGNLLTGVSGVFGSGFLIFFALVFMLLEASHFPGKVRAAFKSSDETLERLQTLNRSLNRYLGLKTIISLFTGVTVYVFLRLFGVDFALIWGLVAFLLNFIPNIGSFIAAIPAVIVAYLQLGPGTAALVALGYLVINATVGGFIEPRVMGGGMGLSPLVVFFSIFLWGWILGVVGMLLSVPLTMAIKLALESRESTRCWAVLLGPREPEPAAAPAAE